MTPAATPPKPKVASGLYLAKADVMLLSGLLGANIVNPDSLKRAVERAMTFCIEGAEIRLESGVLERLRSRAQASRLDVGEYLRREVVRLLRSEVGY